MRKKARCQIVDIITNTFTSKGRLPSHRRRLPWLVNLAPATPSQECLKVYGQWFGIIIHWEVKNTTSKVEITRATPPQSQEAEQHLERTQHSHQRHHVILASVKSNEQDYLKVK